MSRKPKTEAAEDLTQATQPRPMDANGFELDAWNLPLVGPARIRALNGRPDPAIDEAGWKAATGAAGDPATNQEN